MDLDLLDIDACINGKININSQSFERGFRSILKSKRSEKTTKTI